MSTVRSLLSVGYNVYLGSLIGMFLALELSPRLYVWDGSAAWTYQVVFAISFAILSHYRQTGWSKLTILLLFMAMLGGIQLGDDLGFFIAGMFMGAGAGFSEVYAKHLTIQLPMMLAGGVAGPLFWHIVNDTPKS